ncbi:MAG: hypothetical protein EOP05_14880 [Proteobacteria bacterium]|nr:MAG: hypothetical protein EOP05_14880 [Pseudomonadota bacterium]
MKDEKGNTFVFYERVTEERDGLPWTTEIFARRMVSSLKADKKEIPVLQLPRSKAGLARSWPAAQRAFGGALLEGPRPFKIGAYYFISFSAGDYTSDEYGIHLAWSTSLTGPYEPYLTPTADDLLNFGETLESETQRLTWGAARGSFFEANGKWWVLYHGIDENRPRLGAYIEDGLRDVYLAPVTIKPRSNRKAGSPPFEILLGH